uniref:ARID domain-containing protein n=1 Tax=Dracunculus medinensis TaxID=318479 RepID=A0A158Q4A7_DRAME
LGFMHRIGKPVTRIPIMAKQVLDLYELYRLVVQHGGLVEIINKKLWREITKGLNLPSSITSAAFTLRTQYQKFLYDYECEKEGLSNPADLQQAIDGNRREGRRNTTNSSAFPALTYSVAGASGLLTKHLNGSLNLRNGLEEDVALRPSVSQQAALVAAYRAEHYAALEAQQRQFERAQRAAVEAVARQSLHASAVSGRESTSSVDSDGHPPAKRLRNSSSVTIGGNDENDTAFTNQTMDKLFSGIPSAHLKITSRKDGHNSENSLVVSMEINGVMYQGVLFALNGNSSRNSSSENVSGLNLSNSMKIAL